MKLTLSITTNDPSTNTAGTRSYGNVNRDYITLTQPGAAHTLPYYNGTQYESFASWTNAVARGIVSLSNNTYMDSLINATFSVNEEMNS